MPKRKLEQEQSAIESDLSPPPDGLLEEPKASSAEVSPDATVKEPASKKRRTRQIKPEPADEEGVVDGIGTTKKARAPRKQKVTYEEHDSGLDGKATAAPTPEKKRKTKTKVKTKVSVEVSAEGDGKDIVVEKKVQRKRKTKEEKEAEAMPLAARTLGQKLFIGAHVSSAGGVQNAVSNGVHIGANAFALFLKSQRKWANPALADDVATSFHTNCETHSYDQARHVVPHGSYLVNLAHTDKTRTEQAFGAFLDDLQRCERLGIKLYNFHPGVANSTNGDREAAIAHLASNINRAHRQTSTVVTLLENMAAGGNVLGSTFEDLHDTIALIEDKERVGVCLDTCHAFAAGYDLRTPEAFQATMSKFQHIVGLKYLRAVHMNDSKAPYDSHRDLHANIGTGFLGLRAFHNIVNDPRFEGVPIVLETPIDAKDEEGTLLKDDKGKDKEDKGIWAREIKMLEQLVGMDVGSEEFLRMETALARKGEPERKRLTEQIERKKEKDEKKAKSPKMGKGKKSKKDESQGEESSLSELESDGG